MSTTLTAYCEIHEVFGPRIHRNAGGAVGLWPGLGEDIFDPNLSRDDWNRWLIEHEFCNFQMIG